MLIPPLDYSNIAELDSAILSVRIILISRVILIILAIPVVHSGLVHAFFYAAFCHKTVLHCHQ